MSKSAQAKLLVAAIALLVALVFALQNSDPVTVSVLVWEFGMSLALVVFASLGLGAACAWGIFGAWRLLDKVGDGKPKKKK